jgi:hypothetical protein
LLVRVADHETVPLCSFLDRKLILLHVRCWDRADTHDCPAWWPLELPLPFRTYEELRAFLARGGRFSRAGALRCERSIKSSYAWAGRCVATK